MARIARGASADLPLLDPRIEFLGAIRNRLGESPLWDPGRRWLWWIDSGANAIRAGDAAGTLVIDWRYEQQVGSIAFAADGLVAAFPDGFYRIDIDNGKASRIAAVRLPAPSMRLNDGKADRFGRFLCGHLNPHGEKLGELWRLDRDGTTRRLLDGFGVTNGICFSPDGGTLYVADSLDGMLRRYSYDGATGTLGPREDLVDCRAYGSGADGATVDAQGRIWVALVLARKIACFTPDGALHCAIDLPIPYPSCPAFGGDDLSTLYVTTIADSGNRLVSDHPDAGRILAITGLDAKGLIEPAYAPYSRTDA
jgi:sugar lactone lactonase YvrE